MKVTGCKKIYNAENIMEAEMLVEMLKKMELLHSHRNQVQV